MPHTSISTLDSSRRRRNALRASDIKAKIEAKRLLVSLPTHLARKDIHELLMRNIEDINIIDKAFESTRFESKVESILRYMNTNLSSVVYNYLIAGPSSWNKFINDNMQFFTGANQLTSYEESALKKLNYNAYYFTNTANFPQLKSINDGIYKTLKLELEELNNYKKIKSEMYNSKFNKTKYDLLEKNKTDIERKNNFFVNLYILLKQDFPKNGISFYITDNKQPIPSDSNIFETKNKFEIQLVIFNEDGDLNTDDNISKLLALKQKPSAITKKARKTATTTTAKKPVKIATTKTTTTTTKKLPTVSSVLPPRTQPTRTQPSRSAKKTGGTGENLGQNNKIRFKKNIFSINICVDDNFETSKLNSIMDTTHIFHHLNEAGLILVQQQTKESYFIHPSQYNTPSIRDNIIKKMDSQISEDVKRNKLEQITWAYNDIFYRTVFYKEKAFIKLLDKFLKTTNIGSFMNNLEIEIIEKFRPFINACILNINVELQSVPEFNNDIGIYIAGGDAIRRYKNDVTQTKDIDTKIYIPKKYHENNAYLELIVRIIYSNVIKLYTYFLIYKDSVLGQQNKQRIEKYSSSLFDYEVKIDLYNLIDKKISNFKFRQLYKKPSFPVDLFSLDYKAETSFTITKKDTLEVVSLPFNFEISFLDIVVEMLDTNESYYKKYSIFSNNLPISTLEFLIEDLTKTYNSIKSSSFRFLSGKIEKDHTRYDTLLKIKNNIEYPVINTDIDGNTEYKSLNPFKYQIDPDGTKRLVSDTNYYLPLQVLQREDYIRGILDYAVQYIQDPRNLVYYSLNDYIVSLYEARAPLRNKLIIDYNELEQKLTEVLAVLIRTGGKAMPKSSYSKKKFDKLLESTQKLKLNDKSIESYDAKLQPLSDDTTLKCLVNNNCLLHSYAFYVDLDKNYDGLYYACEAHIMGNAEYLITDDDIIENENVSILNMYEYRRNCYKKHIHDFFNKHKITVPPFSKNQHFYEIELTDSYEYKDVEKLIKEIDEYGGSAIFYEPKQEKSLS